jgi:1-acyl-sn-glycerol-3-phosphate acyltransferase
MNLIRSALFNSIFFIITLAMGILGFPILMGPEKWVNWYGHLWAHICLGLLKKIVGLKYEVRGVVPHKTAIIAAKHQSAWETLAFVTILKEPTFIMKRSLLFLPPIGPYLWRAGMVAIDRASGATAIRRMLTKTARIIKTGRPVIIFPEGTRRAPGAPPSYLAGTAALYRGLDLPTIPVALNSGVFWGRNAFTKRKGTVVIEFLPAIPPGLDRRTFMNRLEDEIETATHRLVKEAKQQSRVVR